MREGDDERAMVYAEIRDMLISSKNLVEVGHVGPSHNEVVSSDNQFAHIDQSS